MIFRTVVESTYQATGAPFVILFAASSIAETTRVCTAIIFGGLHTNLLLRAIRATWTLVVRFAPCFATIRGSGEACSRSNRMEHCAVVYSASESVIAATSFKVVQFRVTSGITNTTSANMAVAVGRISTHVLACAVTAMGTVPVRKATFTAVRRRVETSFWPKLVKFRAVVEPTH